MGECRLAEEKQRLHDEWYNSRQMVNHRKMTAMEDERQRKIKRLTEEISKKHLTKEYEEILRRTEDYYGGTGTARDVLQKLASEQIKKWKKMCSNKHIELMLLPAQPIVIPNAIQKRQPAAIKKYIPMKRITTFKYHNLFVGYNPSSKSWHWVRARSRNAKNRLYM